MRRNVAVQLLLMGTLALCRVTAASAQDRGASLSGSVFASNMDSRTDVAMSGAFGYRFSRVVSFEIETTLVPKVHAPYPPNPVVIQNTGLTTFTTASPTSVAVQLFPTPTYSNPGGRVVMFTNSVRIDIPTTASSLTPYFTAGGGIASIRRTVDFTYPIFLSPLLPPPQGSIIQPTLNTEHISSTSTDLALTLGGGLNIRLGSALSLDADLRIFRLLEDSDRNLGRFGVGIRYRF